MLRPIKYPYNKETLEKAYSDIADKAGLIEFWNDIPNEDFDMRKLNKKIARFHGIKVKTLVSSINYKYLIAIYELSKLEEKIKAFMVETELSHVEAWSIIAMINNKIFY